MDWSDESSIFFVESRKAIDGRPLVVRAAGEILRVFPGKRLSEILPQRVLARNGHMGIGRIFRGGRGSIADGFATDHSDGD